MLKAIIHHIFPRRQLLALVEQWEERYAMTMRESGWLSSTWTTRQFLIAGITVYENREVVRDENLVHWVIDQIDDHETYGIAMPTREIRT